MGSLKPFFKTILQSFNPNSYQHLSTRDYWSVFHYLMSVIFILLLVISLLSLPTIARIPKVIDNELSKFTKFSVSADIEMSGPIVFNEDDPQIIVDTTGEYQNITSQTLVVTTDNIYYKPFLKVTTYETKILKDVVENRGIFVFLIWLLIILVLPMLFLMMFTLYLAKYLLIILGTGFVAFIVMSLLKYEIKIRHLVKIGVYAATPMMIIDILSVPFFDSWGIPYVLFGFYFVVGLAMNAERKIVHHGRKSDEF